MIRAWPVPVFMSRRRLLRSAALDGAALRDVVRAARYVARHVEARGYPPTGSEGCAALGWSVWRWARAVALGCEVGLLSRVPRSPRTVLPAVPVPASASAPLVRRLQRAHRAGLRRGRAA